MEFLAQVCYPRANIKDSALRIGLFEIGILVVVVLVIFMATRLWGIGKSGSKDTKTANSQTKTNNRRWLRISGIVLIVIGIVFLLANISVFKWMMWSYAWLLALILVGLVLVLLFRK